MPFGLFKMLDLQPEDLPLAMNVQDRTGDVNTVFCDREGGEIARINWSRLIRSGAKKVGLPAAPSRFHTTTTPPYVAPPAPNQVEIPMTERPAEPHLKAVP